jgi:hypothetical protein
MAEVFQVGEKVPFSGVYKVAHAGEHRQAHHVTAVSGEIFPGCLQCCNEVRFELLMCAVHIKVHPLFDRRQANKTRRRVAQIVGMLRALRRTR